MFSTHINSGIQSNFQSRIETSISIRFSLVLPCFTFVKIANEKREIERKIESKDLLIHVVHT